MSYRLILLLLVASALVVGCLAADWWFCLPEGLTADYVDSGECTRCHEDETNLWTGSDHDLAMDPATPATVLGNFDNRKFTRVVFKNIAKLSDGDLRTVLKHVENSLWVSALKDAGEQLKEKVLGGMSKGDSARLSEEMEKRRIVRPCDAMVARDEIVEIVRRLAEGGEIAAPPGVVTKFFRRGDKYYVTTDGPTGELETFQIKYTFGTWPLQQYMVEFPDGRVQCLPIAWDCVKQRWFHLYPNENIPAGDVLHWTGAAQNWNYMCAECHSTNLLKKYDLKTDTFHTTFSQIDVNCQTCHGPGSIHVKLADSWGIFWDRRYGYGLPSLKDENSRIEIETCAPCHSHRRVVYPDHRAGKNFSERNAEKFLDYYMPSLLDGILYYADGQILEEDYVYGSFIQSKMYQQGIRCTDCHDPHSTRVKFADPDAPRGEITNNRVCTECHMNTHPAGKYDTPAHHHHPDSSKPGTLCVDCHMPETTYMVVDPRRDHSMLIPRPDLTISLGIPNACNGCHHDESKGETPEWAEDLLQKWYGKRKGPKHFAYAIDAGRKGEPEGELMLEAITRRKDLSPMVKASAILLLSRYQSRAGHAAVLSGLGDPEELVRAAAVRAMERRPVDKLRTHLAPMLYDPVRAVRTEAARILSRVTLNKLNEKDRQAFDAALAEYMAGQEYLGDQAPAQMNMGVIHANLGEFEKAQREYKTAIRLDRRFVPARVNLAMLYARQENKAEAVRQLRELVALQRELLEEAVRRAGGAADPGHDPADAGQHASEVIQLRQGLAEAHYSLGLLLAEDESRLAEAAESLGKAATLDRRNPRMYYNYGLALQKLGRADQAERALAAAYNLAPDVPDYLHALAILYTQQERWQRAIQCAGELVRRHPGDPRMRALLEHLKRQAGQSID